MQPQKNELLLNLEKLHTTDLGIIRIKRNLSLDEAVDVVEWCREKMQSPNAVVRRKGKNWYINIERCEITVNAYSYTIITAHKKKRKVYFDKTAPKNVCTSIFVKDAEVIAAGTTVYSMSVREKCAEYQKYADEYGIYFIFDDKLPGIDFYTVPQIDIFATDDCGGLLGTIGETSDFNADAPICYIDKNQKCFWAAENGNAFLASADSWRERLSPYKKVAFYQSIEDAKQQLEFIEPESWEENNCQGSLGL